MTPLQMLSIYSEKELEDFAEGYFASMVDRTHVLTKPWSLDGSLGKLLAEFASLVYAGEFFPGAYVLDFGAGSCWTSNFLAQAGIDVVASDVSKTALEIGKQRLKLHPIIANLGSLKFELSSSLLKDPSYNGKFDRIIMMDAFHHIANQQALLEKFFTLLAPGGRLVLSEPGINHSTTETSQNEMKQFKVLERDFNVIEVGILAEEVGFENIQSGFFSPVPIFFSYQEQNLLLKGHPNFIVSTAQHAKDHSLMRMFKPGKEKIDSRRRNGLRAQIEFESGSRMIKIKNIGETIWLGEKNRIGAVHIGITEVKRDGTFGERGKFAFPLSQHNIEPGEQVIIYWTENVYEQFPEEFEIDLFSNHVTWFRDVGSRSLHVNKKER